MSTPAIGVCGFGRCGSTMAMAMLDAGGVSPVQGSKRVSYELPSLEEIAGLGPMLQGRTVKLLDAVRYYPLPTIDWQFLWLDRDYEQQARSQAKFFAALVGFDPPDMAHRLTESYKLDRPATLAAYRRLGPVTVLRYEEVLAEPLGAALQLAEIAPGLDVAAAAAAVHTRSPECRPDLAFELSA